MTRLGSVATVIALGLGMGCAPAASQDTEIDSQAEALSSHGACRRPVEAVLHTLNCVEQEDATCAAAGYAPGFVKLHNTVDTHTVISGPDYWAGAFFLLDFNLDIDHVAKVGKNEVSIRYIEHVTTLFGEQFLQHEHALVRLNKECKMELWDQYGDNAEQKAVDDAVAAILAQIYGNP